MCCDPSSPVVNPSSPVVSGSPAKDRSCEDPQDLLEPQDVLESRNLTLRLDGFARETIEEEASRMGVPVEELIAFAVLYYLADVDSGRIARRISASPYPMQSAERARTGDWRRGLDVD